jgi:hypothetical protein
MLMLSRGVYLGANKIRHFHSSPSGRFAAGYGRNATITDLEKDGMITDLDEQRLMGHRAPPVEGDFKLSDHQNATKNFKEQVDSSYKQNHEAAIEQDLQLKKVDEFEHFIGNAQKGHSEENKWDE